MEYLFEEMAVVLVEAVEDLGEQTRALDDPAALSIDDVFDLDYWTRQLSERLGPHVAEALRRGFESGALSVSFSGSFNADAPGVRDVVRLIVSRSASVPATLQAAVAGVIEEGLSSEISYAEMAARIQDVVEAIKPWKALQVARAAGGSGFESGRQVAFREAGITRHRWISSRDGHVRASHQVDGETVEIGAPFSNGLLYPLDPNGPAHETINCRCTVLPVADGSISMDD